MNLAHYLSSSSFFLLASRTNGKYMYSTTEGFDFVRFNAEAKSDIIFDCEVPEDSTNIKCIAGYEFGKVGGDLQHSVVTECEPTPSEDGLNQDGIYGNCKCTAYLNQEVCEEVPCNVCGDKTLGETFTVEYTCYGEISRECPNPDAKVSSSTKSAGGRKLELAESENRKLQLGNDTFLKHDFNISSDLVFDCVNSTDKKLVQECGLCVNLGRAANDTVVEHCVNITCSASTRGDGLWEDCSCVATLNGNVCTEDPCRVRGGGDLDETFAVDYDCIDIKTGPEGSLSAAGYQAEEEEEESSGVTKSKSNFVFMALVAVILATISL